MKRDKQGKRGFPIGKGRSHGTYRKKRKPNSKYIKSNALN